MTAADVIGGATASLGGSCFLTDAVLTLSGPLTSELPDGQGVTVELADTDVGFGEIAFTEDCFPESYALWLAGPAMLSATGTDAAAGAGAVETLAVVFEDLTVAQNLSGNPAITAMDGDVTSECFGETVTLTTIEDLAIPIGEGCPESGMIGLSAASGLNALIGYSSGMVSADNDADGVIDKVFPSCFDPALLVCPALL